MNLKAFLAIEATLTSRLMQAWEEYARPVLTDIHTLARAGKQAEAIELVNGLDLTPVFEENKAYIDFVTRAALLFGAMRAHAKISRSKVLSTHKEIIANAGTLLRNTILVSVEDLLRRYLLERVAEMDLANPLTPNAASEITFKFDPDQPRAPKGTPEGGKWIHWDRALPLKNSLGIARIDMPQIKWKDYAEFQKFVKRNGGSMSEEKVYARTLKPAQNEFNPHKTRFVEKDLLKKPIIISKDNYVLDGTHRWVYFRTKQPSKKMLVLRMSFNAREALKLMHSFPKAESHGINAPTEPVEKYDPNQPRAPEGSPEGGQWVASGLPPEPGTAPIPEGHVRLYHQTLEENLDTIAKEGLLLSKAKGIEGPKAIWASPKPFYGDAQEHPTVEFHVPADQYEGYIVHTASVPPENIVAIHRPWHAQARYLEKDPEAIKSVLAGEFDHLLDDPTYSKALGYIKRMYGKSVKRDVGEYVMPLVSFEGDVFNQAEGLFGMISALHTSRLSAFGFTVEAEVRGLSRYAINAQLDKRVCDVCDVMDGREFPVDSAQRLLSRALGADNPEDLKTIQPWPPQDARSVDEIAAMSEEDLIARGWNVPPFHPWCRCLLVKVGEGMPADQTSSAVAARVLDEPVPQDVYDAFPALTVASVTSAREAMAGLSGETAISAWENLLELGWGVDELEAIFGVLSEDVLNGDIAF